MEPRAVLALGVGNHEVPIANPVILEPVVHGVPSKGTEVVHGGPLVDTYSYAHSVQIALVEFVASSGRSERFVCDPRLPVAFCFCPPMLYGGAGFF